MLDSALRPIRVGQTVEACHCIGPHGQTRTVQGELLEFNQYGGIYIRLGPETRPFREFNRFGCDSYGPGSKYYVADAFEYNPKIKARVGYHEHKDIEHAHKTWCTILKDVEEPCTT